MNDSSDVLALLAAAVPAGPRDHELMTLHDLAGYVAIRFDMPEAGAGRTVVAALLGDDHWKSKAPESLPVYLRLTTGPRALCDQWTEWQGEKDPPPERWQSLRHLALGLTFGCCTINEVPEGRNYDHHAGRFLAVVEEDAWQAFGLNQPAAPIDTPPAPVPAVVQSGPAPEEQPSPTAWKDAAGCWTAAAVAEMNAMLGAGKTATAVGNKFGISRTRIGQLTKKRNT